jgi:hypothetical protein
VGIHYGTGKKDYLIHAGELPIALKVNNTNVFHETTVANAYNSVVVGLRASLCLNELLP